MAIFNCGAELGTERGNLDITEFDIMESDLSNFKEFYITQCDITEKEN